MIHHLRHLYAKLEMRWATKFPRYRAYLLREIKRLETILPTSRPAEIPTHEWLPPEECRRILRHGPRILQARSTVKPSMKIREYMCTNFHSTALQTPPHLPANVTERWLRTQETLQKLVSAQEQVAVRHYLRLVSEGRLPPPPAEEEEAMEDETEVQREERLAAAEQERAIEVAREEAEDERCRREALTEMMVPEVVWNSLIGNGYNASEALEAVRWVSRMNELDQQGEIKWEALRVPEGLRNRWEGVDTATLDVPADAHPRLKNMALRAHSERVHLSNSSYNSEPFVEGVVLHPFVYRGDALPGYTTAAQRGLQDNEAEDDDASPGGSATAADLGGPSCAGEGLELKGGRRQREAALVRQSGDIIDYVDAKLLGEDAVDQLEGQLRQGDLFSSRDAERDRRALSALVDWIKHGME
jgi:hypothetical protein